MSKLDFSGHVHSPQTNSYLLKMKSKLLFVFLFVGAMQYSSVASSFQYWTNDSPKSFPLLVIFRVEYFAKHPTKPLWFSGFTAHSPAFLSIHRSSSLFYTRKKANSYHHHPKYSVSFPFSHFPWKPRRLRYSTKSTWNCTAVFYQPVSKTTFVLHFALHNNLNHTSSSTFTIFLSPFYLFTTIKRITTFRLHTHTSPLFFLYNFFYKSAHAKPSSLLLRHHVFFSFLKKSLYGQYADIEPLIWSFSSSNKKTDYSTKIVLSKWTFIRIYYSRVCGYHIIYISFYFLKSQKIYTK